MKDDEREKKAWHTCKKHDEQLRSEKNDTENNRKEDTYSGVCMFLFSLETKQNLWIK